MKVKTAKGFALLEIMISIVLVMIATTIGYQYYDNYLTEQLNQVTAQQHKQVIKAAQTYIKSNYSTIAAQSMPYTISMATLQSSNSGLASLSKNPYGQSYSVVVRNPGSGLMAMVITTGGQVIEEGSLTRIARLVGAEGGYISSTNAALASGAFKAWNETLSNYGVAPGAGHLAGSIFFDNASIASDFLYRSAVSGMPALNTMNTDINMGGHNVNNAGALNGASASFTGAVSANTVSATTVSTTTLNANAVNTNASTVNGNQSVTGTQSVGALLNSGPTTLNGPTTINAPTTVNGAFVGNSVKSTLDVIASRYLQLNTAVTEGTSCSSLGVGYVARDSSGAILSCQSGVWKSQGRDTAVLSQNGCTELPSGLTLQWGYIPNIVAGGSYSVTLPCVNSTALFSISVTQVRSSVATGANSFFGFITSKNTFTAYNGTTGSGSLPAYWMAIGY